MSNAKKIAIVTDCTSDLTEELRKRHNIISFPLYINLNGKTYSDGVDITPIEMYKIIDKCGELPKTSNASPAVIEERFANILKEYDQIVYIGIGSGLSATYNNARIAALNFPEDTVYVIDSANLSTGIGLLVLKAAKFRDQGFTAKEIASKVTELVPCVSTQFVVNTLNYLHMGGRCNGTQKLFANLLRMKPIIRVVDGAMMIAKKPLGFNKGLECLLEYIRRDVANVDPDYVFVTHAVADADAEYLISQLKTFIKADHIVETYASGVISSHCGPRTIGILYIVNK